MTDEKQIFRWVLRAQVGDRDALDALLQAVQQPLYRCIAGIIRDAALAEDVLQEVFMQIYRKLRWLREPSLFPSWAYRIATRRAIRELDRARRRESPLRDSQWLEELPAAEGVSRENMEQTENIEKLLNHVSPTNRPVLVLHYLQGLTLQETADVLGLAVGTVKSRLANALKGLRLVSGVEPVRTIDQLTSEPEDRR